MEHKVHEQEARAAALKEMASDSVETRFAELGMPERVERELAELKGKQPISSPDTAPSLPGE
jgi:phage shock protein A